MIGRDWTHLGVAKLYTDITRNGYKVMYLTSRAIGQADATRDYLKGIKQNNYQLPEGPVIMSPDRLMASLHRYVVAFVSNWLQWNAQSIVIILIEKSSCGNRKYSKWHVYEISNVYLVNPLEIHFMLGLVTGSPMLFRIGVSMSPAPGYLP